jgi:iron complex transport system substrate-binding protein
MLTILRVRGASFLKASIPFLSGCLWLISVSREVAAGVVNIFGGYNQMDNPKCNYQRTHVISSHFCMLMFLLCVLLLAACGQSTPAQTRSTPTTVPAKATPTPALDAYGTPIAFPQTAPQRIISLAASTSEILGGLHLQGHVVAVDFYTTYPSDIAALPKISDANGTYNVEQIVGLKPDLVLSQGGLTKKYDAQLAGLGLHVVDLPSANFSQVLQQVQLVGRLTATQDAAKTLVQQLQQRIDQIEAAVAGTTAPKVLLEVDDSTAGKPYVFGGGSFGDELLQDANATNIFHDNTSGAGYPQVSDEAIITANPQFVILTEDPLYGGDPSVVYKRANWGSIDAVKAHKVYHINTNLMQHPSQRLVDGLRCVAQLVHPDKFTDPLPDYCSGTK